MGEKMARKSILHDDYRDTVAKILHAVSQSGSVARNNESIASYYILRQLQEAKLLDYQEVASDVKTRGRKRKTFKLSDEGNKWLEGYFATFVDSWSA